MKIPRPRLVQTLLDSISYHPVTALLGPRQCGKTTVSRMIGNTIASRRFDLEEPADRQALEYSPREVLGSLNGLIIIDEIQRMPQLFPILRVLSDQEDSKRNFLILGSASPELIRHSSETLAGRIAFIDMSGFNLQETGIADYRKLWLRGGFPLSFLAETDERSYKWRGDFIRTFLEMDIPQMGFNISQGNLRKFWIMVAHYHGHIWNASELSRSLGVSAPTVQSYLEIMSGAFVARQIQPWHENMGKRQVKSPKVYIRDSGLFHQLLSLPGDQILFHPKLGASWEGFIIEQLISYLNLEDVYFWATHSGAELDLLFFINGKKYGVEVKWNDAPAVTRSMISAIESLGLEKLFVIYPGQKAYPLSEKILATGIICLEETLKNALG